VDIASVKSMEKGGKVFNTLLVFQGASEVFFPFFLFPRVKVIIREIFLNKFYVKEVNVR